MSMTSQDDLFHELAIANDRTFNELILASLKRNLTPEEAQLIHRTCELKLRVEDGL